MAIHHIVTVWLIGVSYAYGWNRVGSVVMVLLDPADVPLHIAKQFKYIGDVRDGFLKTFCQTAADIFFCCFHATLRLHAPWAISLRCLDCTHGISTTLGGSCRWFYVCSAIICTVGASSILVHTGAESGK